MFFSFFVKKTNKSNEMNIVKEGENEVQLEQIRLINREGGRERWGGGGRWEREGGREH